MRDKRQFLLFNRRMITVIGLGNPGKKYENTRHNIGFVVLDEFAQKEELSFDERSPLLAMIVQVRENLVLAKSTTFMNESGKAAEKIMRNFDTSIIVVHDDIDIPIGEVKCSFGRGSGDHNGVQSIINALGHKEFGRIRIGVRPVHEELLPRIAPPDGYEKFLLSDFAPMEEELKKKGIAKALEIIAELPEKTFSEIMSQYN